MFPLSEAKRKTNKKVSKAEKKAEKKGSAGLEMLVKNIGVKDKVEKVDFTLKKGTKCTRSTFKTARLVLDFRCKPVLTRVLCISGTTIIQYIWRTSSPGSPSYREYCKSAPNTNIHNTNPLFSNKLANHIITSFSPGTAEMLTETYFLSNIEDKDVHLFYLLLNHPGKTLVFANSIDGVMNLVHIMKLLQVPVYPLHSALQQRQRFKFLDRFKETVNAVLVSYRHHSGDALWLDLGLSCCDN